MSSTPCMAIPAVILLPIDLYLHIWKHYCAKCPRTQAEYIKQRGRGETQPVRVKSQDPHKTLKIQFTKRVHHIVFLSLEFPTWGGRFCLTMNTKMQWDLRPCQVPRCTDCTARCTPQTCTVLVPWALSRRRSAKVRSSPQHCCRPKEMH